MTTVINRKSGQAYDVYIGRPSKWGNPFKIGRDGTRSEVIEKYRAHVLDSPALLAALPELEAKALGCWCKPEACHGDVLVELVDAFFKSVRDQREEAFRVVARARGNEALMSQVRQSHKAEERGESGVRLEDL